MKTTTDASSSAFSTSPAHALQVGAPAPHGLGAAPAAPQASDVTAAPSATQRLKCGSCGLTLLYRADRSAKDFACRNCAVRGRLSPVPAPTTPQAPAPAKPAA